MRLGSLTTKAVAALGIMLFPLAARAAFLAGDTNAVVHGTQNFTRTFGSNSFNANIDYAVYQPGQFNLSFPGQDPSANLDYVYAYQIINVGGGTNPQSINFLSVGFNSAQAAPSLFSVIGLPAPDSTQLPNNGTYTTAVNWNYNLSPIPVSSSSAILLYVSPMAPSTASASVSGVGVIGQNGTLPSPIPEPTVGLVLLGAAAVVGLGRRLR